MIEGNVRTLLLLAMFVATAAAIAVSWLGVDGLAARIGITAAVTCVVLAGTMLQMRRE